MDSDLATLQHPVPDDLPKGQGRWSGGSYSFRARKYSSNCYARHIPQSGTRRQHQTGLAREIARQAAVAPERKSQVGMALWPQMACLRACCGVAFTVPVHPVTPKCNGCAP